MKNHFYEKLITQPLTRIFNIEFKNKKKSYFLLNKVKNHGCAPLESALVQTEREDLRFK